MMFRNQEKEAPKRSSPYGDAAAAAAQAKDKLMERQEKLARIAQESAELQSESENFASLAQQITKSMESKMWWRP
ncbi:uncharacterized protein LOC100842006 [Brachypodium distachyon]|nr:uncharacterized protein LOC100842006 [Brachypodium distachyon]|eukprot:XP_024312939.1 uncharacterized protein LOC100842006 [Brachypodium distachyon]